MKSGLAFARGLSDSGTLGLAPKLHGAALAPLMKLIRPDLFGDMPLSEIYAMGRDASRQGSAESEKEDPYAYLGGQLAGFLPFPFPARGATKTIAAGAGYGAAHGFNSNDESLDSKLLSAGLGGGLGALGGAVGYGINKGGHSVYNKFFAPRQKATEEAIKNIGLGNKFGVPLTEAEITRNPAKFYEEELVQMGKAGVDNQNNYKAAIDKRNEAFTNALEEVRSSLGGGQPFVENNVHLADSVNKVTKRAIDARKPIDAAYDKAHNTVGYLDIKTMRKFPKKVERELIDSGVTPSESKLVYDTLKGYKELFSNMPKGAKGIDFRRIEGFLKSINENIYSSSVKDSEKRGLNIIKKNLNHFLEDTVENALIHGDENVLREFKAARALNHEWKKTYGEGHKTDFGKRFLGQVIENARRSNEPFNNKVIVDKVFQGGELGFGNKTSSIIKELKKHTTPEEFNGIKLEAANRLLSPLTKNTPSVITYINNLNKFTKGNPELARELFSPKEITMLKEFGDLAHKLYGARNVSKMNPSGSGVLLKLAKKRLPFLQDLAETGIETDFQKIQSDIIKGTRKTSTMGTGHKYAIPPSYLSTEANQQTGY